MDPAPMTDTPAPYPQMRAVSPTRAWNVRWIGELPAQWDFVSSKWLFSASGELAREGDEQLSATQAYGVISQKTYQERIGRKITQITKNLEKRKHVEADDFVISMRSFEGGIERAWESGCIRSSYVVLQPGSRVHVPFFQYLFKCHPFIQALQTTSNFIRDGQDLNLKNFHLLDLPLPPLGEQVAAAKVLSHMDVTARKLVRAKRRLVGLLNEQKQAIIHRAVTRGLDPDVPLKPSGIDWLGDIPAHWEVRRLKTIATINPPRSRDLQTEQTATFLPMEKVNADGTFDPSITAPIADLSTGYTAFQRGDVILAKITPCFENGKAAYLDGLPTKFGFGSTEFITIRPRAEVRGGYLFLLVHEPKFRELGEQSMTGSAGQQRVAPEFVSNFYVALPPRREQLEILTTVSERHQEIDTAIAQIQSEIALIQEYRTRLIADVVTGGLDVRALAAGLPDTAPEELVPDAGDEADDLTDADETQDEEAVA